MHQKLHCHTHQIFKSKIDWACVCALMQLRIWSFFVCMCPLIFHIDNDAIRGFSKHQIIFFSGFVGYFGVFDKSNVAQMTFVKINFFNS